ncbi:MAG: NifU family protein [Acidimicrobiales bacterium]|jgi:Fe/S biogenesis protein NfuA
MSVDTNLAEETTVDNVVMSVSDEALTKVLEVRSAEEDPESFALRVEVTGISGVEFSYDLSVDPLAEADKDDVIYSVGELSVIIPGNSVGRLQGATLDLPSNPVQGGLVIRNPNRPNPLDGYEIELSGTITEKLQQLLEQRINPALASHGGTAELLKVEDTVVHILMGGGCQGCAMSAATLREGITVMISEAIPEITQVIDATDHTEGENPYFE